jgi:long-chain fatty acid transport protein
MTKLTSILIVAGLGSVAHANAFLLNEFDAKAVGRGNASVATDVDPSSIYYNVGGLAASSDPSSVQVGGSIVSPEASFTPTGATQIDSNTPTQAIVGVFGAAKITDMFTAGLGVYTPFGLAVHWPGGTEPAQVAREIQLHTFFITPAVGANLGSFVPGLSVGGGIDVVPATLELKQDIAFGTDLTGNAHLGATAVGVGGRIGVMYKPNSFRDLSLGVMWRSAVHLDFTGNADFSVDASTPQYRSLLPPDGSLSTKLTLPQQVSGGIAYKVMPNLEIEGNAIWTNWSQFKDLTLNVPAIMGTGTMPITQVQNYSDEVTWRFGAEWNIPTIAAAIRAGFIYDPSPIPTNHLTAQLPDINRYDVTLGASKSLGSFDVHFGLLWVLEGTRSTAMTSIIDPNNTPQQQGSYTVSAFVGSFTLQGRFGRLGG